MHRPDYVHRQLAAPGLDLFFQNRLDGLWNEDFKRMVRNAVLGKNDDGETSFEWTVRNMIDRRLVGFRDGAEAVNYVGSHDVEGFRNERLYNFLDNNGVPFKEGRVKLAFVCLLTAVGIPMILAGDEFADEHDLAVTHPAKQRDAVNFGRLVEPRRRVFDYVARLVKLRTSNESRRVGTTSRVRARQSFRPAWEAYMAARAGTDPGSSPPDCYLPGEPDELRARLWRLCDHRDLKQVTNALLLTLMGPPRGPTGAGSNR